MLNVTGVSAVGKLFFHLGQMVGADMSAFIATDVADIICSEVMSLYGVMVRRIAGADMSMTVVTLITPFTHVKVVIIIERSVRDIRTGAAAHIKQRATEGALLIFVLTLTVQVADTLPAFAVIIASPGATAVTSPVVGSTVATSGLLEDQATVSVVSDGVTVATRVSVSPTVKVSSDLLSVMSVAGLGAAVMVTGVFTTENLSVWYSNV